MFWTPPSIPWLTLCLWFIWLGTASWNFLVTSSECQRKSLLEDMLCTFQPLAKGDLVDHVLHTLIMYKDCLGIMKEQCKNSRLPHLLMIVVHGETLWSPAPQPMDDDDSTSILYMKWMLPIFDDCKSYLTRSKLLKRSKEVACKVDVNDFYEFWSCWNLK